METTKTLTHLNELITKHNDVFKFTAKGSTLITNISISRTLLSFSETSHYCIVDLVSLLKEIDPTATFDNNVSVAEAFFIGWTDIKTSIGVEDGKDLLIKSKQYLEELVIIYNKAIELISDESQALKIFKTHQEHINKQLINIENHLE
ncbi:hypothetical protein ULMS_26910 [Patiriisocius marinistellae]|uniref:DUF2383 domain-containing protein n=1 Tax=Patiriisocius marinistellae TaxID=2494560 RepID=A0A5J4FYQ0_9FLAO|nr:hypothetical protein [Patiriisocius marinistellae]GEQ87183.1 hypothetical protein ULMS_26910 [Patiriisocius marinistellae]